MKQKKVQIIPYLAFCDNCEEAVNTYIHAFGGEILHLSRYSGETCGGYTDRIGKVMHMEFNLGATRMSAGDNFEAGGANTHIKLMIHMDSKEEALHTISVLAEGGSILWPLQPHPKPDDGGCGSGTKDRFGYTWIITCPNPGKQ